MLISYKTIFSQICAASALKEKRANWGSTRKWLGDYLSLSTENEDFEKYTNAASQLKRDERFNKVILRDHYLEIWLVEVSLLIRTFIHDFRLCSPRSSEKQINSISAPTECFWYPTWPFINWIR